MTDPYRDPKIQALFAEAEQDLAGERFTASVIKRVEKKSRRAKVWRWVYGAIIAILAFSLQNSVIPLSTFLVSPLIDVSGFLAQLLAPVNSLAGLLSLGLIGVRAAQKKLFAGYGA